MTQEQIQCAAVWFDDEVETYVHQPKNIKHGFVVCGLRHHNCFTIKAMLQGIIPNSKYTRVLQGFLTNKNRFVDRHEAAIIAFDAKQIKEETLELFSEDLY